MANEIFKGEMMNEEQLDKVVGGNRGELSCDTKFLHALGLMDRFYEPGYCGSHPAAVENAINSALSRFKFNVSPGAGRTTVLPGFHVKANINGKNEYSVANSQIKDRASFYQMICDSVGKPNFDYTKFI